MQIPAVYYQHGGLPCSELRSRLSAEACLLLGDCWWQGVCQQLCGHRLPYFLLHCCQPALAVHSYIGKVARCGRIFAGERGQLPQQQGTQPPQSHQRTEDDLRVVRLESPAHTGGGSSAECSHAGLRPRALDVVTPVQRLPVGAFAMAGARDGGCSNGSLG